MADDVLSYSKEQLEYLWEANQKQLAVLHDEAKQLNDAIARLERNSAVLQSLFDLIAMRKDKDAVKEMTG